VSEVVAVGESWEGKVNAESQVATVVLNPESALVVVKWVCKLDLCKALVLFAAVLSAE